MMKTLLVTFCMFGFSSCSANKKISVSKASQLVMSAQYVFLDAREINEFMVSKIKNAKFVGFNDFSMNQNNFDKTKTYIVYCSVGQRSSDVANKLNKAGYNAFNLEGGLFEWSNSELPLYSSSDELTKKIHGYDKKWAKKINRGEVVLDE